MVSRFACYLGELVCQSQCGCILVVCHCCRVVVLDIEGSNVIELGIDCVASHFFCKQRGKGTEDFLLG